MRRMMTEKEIATVESLRKDGIASLKDAQGNPRFVEGDITMETIEGVTQTYGKWSLSGTHLMIVIAFNVAANTTLNYTTFATINLPKYITDKFMTVFLNYIDKKSFDGFSNDYTQQNITCALMKTTTAAQIISSVNATITKDRSFRIQFDVLIDNE